MLPVVIGIILLLVLVLVIIAVHRRRNETYLCTTCKKPFQQSPEYRCSTKCFDCVNNHKSQDHLNVSYGHARVFATI